MDDLITLRLSEGQLHLLHALTHEAAVRLSREQSRPAALAAIDLWQHLDRVLDAWEREEEAA